MLWRIVRSALLGVSVGLVLVWVMERSPEEADLPLAVGMVILLVVGMGVRRWILFRREKRRNSSSQGVWMHSGKERSDVPDRRS